jgi:hypothetical protein
MAHCVAGELAEHEKDVTNGEGAKFGVLECLARQCPGATYIAGIRGEGRSPSHRAYYRGDRCEYWNKAVTIRLFPRLCNPLLREKPTQAFPAQT